jgi:hypothetical protein
VINPLPSAADRNSLIWEIRTCPSIAAVDVLRRVTEATPGAPDIDRAIDGASSTGASVCPPAADKERIKAAILVPSDILTDKTIDLSAERLPSILAVQEGKKTAKSPKRRIAALQRKNCLIYRKYTTYKKVSK